MSKNLRQAGCLRTSSLNVHGKQIQDLLRVSGQQISEFFLEIVVLCNNQIGRRKESRNETLTVTGIFVLLEISSGRTVKNCSNVGTIAGILPKESIICGTAFFQSGYCNASPEIARHNCTIILRGPIWYLSRCASNVSRRARKFCGST